MKYPSKQIRMIRRRQGIAMMLVMTVVGVAAVLGFAMVSASTMQAMTTNNLKYTAVAEYMADSGMQVAIYYLQYPANYSGTMPNGYYPGQTGITFGSAPSGSADVTVATTGTNLYTITSVGHATTSSGSTINKTITATVQVVTQFQTTWAAAFANDVRMPSFVTGDLETNGKLTTTSSTRISGTALYKTHTGGGVIHNPVALTSGQTVQVPTQATIHDYSTQYTYQGKTYNATKLATTNLLLTTLPYASDVATNPAGVYWTDQNVTIGAGVTINGSLILTNGKLTVTSAALLSTITPKTGLPALVVHSDIDVNTAAAALTINGLVWTGGGLKTGSLLSTLTINGAFISAGGNPIDANYLGTIYLNYNSSNFNVPDFSTVGAVPVGVRIITWSMN